MMDGAMEEVVKEEINRCFKTLKQHQAIDVNYIDFLEVDKDVQVAGEQTIQEIVKEVGKEEDEERLIMTHKYGRQIEGIEQNPGPPTKKQTTLTASVHSGERESIDGELKMLILNMATEIKSLGERIDIRLTKIETRMDDWDKRFCNIEEKLTKCIESQQATEKLASCNSLKVNELEARVEFFETRLREPNLVFYGIEREGDENQADCNLKIQNIIRDKMEIGDDLKITKCHRLSRGSNAPVLVVVPDYADRAKNI
ncbi:hypothetical protein LAZ67_10001287 [Cordylochernes scorpioides]|uniref:Uncharacterized protein n=1 Tax=Cordylochernes scorpioides TaxID=51811 RepID=A0ABY6KWC6_9ARAC|nr:hypothetical protein LAZ67_10001287 [Cordylochernes scorpioides]